ncbi:hypothetical protein EWB00_002732 [Schistosoma japonicum]|uniref:Uncharacterized protein n=1 Tax=Schistosoma japonicum TaxID=6182 RepID=A0A4Z2DB48_SCHJA|nr:hypothetical protein EWB00_002732 [Schistosoma japonicum]
MLVQNPVLPFFAVTGDYCPSASTRSSRTQPFGFRLSVLPVKKVLSPERSLSYSYFSLFPTGQSVDIQSHHHLSSGDHHSNIVTPITVTMPRHSRSNENQDIDLPVFTEPLGPIATGCKRDASALSANCTIPPITTTANIPVDVNDQCTIYLPPKPKESVSVYHCHIGIRVFTFAS